MKINLFLILLAIALCLALAIYCPWLVCL